MSGIDTDDVNAQLAQLLPAAQSGDDRATQRIVALIYPFVLRYARARIGGGRTPTPEDVTQDVCFAVVKALSTYKDQGKPFMAFVYGIAFNKVTDAHRSYVRDRMLPTEDIPDGVSQEADPEGYALDVDASNKMRELLDVLNEKARNIIILRVFVGLSAEETAEIVGGTAGSVRVAQHRALARLREALEEEESAK